MIDVCLRGIISLLLAASPVVAHHVIGAKFDSGKQVTLRGIVTSVDWSNPHVHIYVNVPEAGRTTNWAVELESAVDLRQNGWKRNSLNPGDNVTVQAIAARDGSKQAWANSFVMTSTGRRMFTVADRPAPRPAASAQPAPRWPGGQPRLSPVPGGKGYWAYPTATSLAENGTNVQADANGLLKNIADAPKVAPFQPWARDLYVYRQRNLLKDDPSFVNCLPPGGPRQFQIPHGIQFVEDQDRKRIFVLMGGGNHNWRLIYLDGRAQQGYLGGDADNPLYYGRSAGRWEQDTLVIDTKGFNETFWFSNGGLPHTEQLHLIERITRPDLNTLKYEVTIDDPGAYTRPWSASWTMSLVPDQVLPEYFCQDNRP